MRKISTTGQLREFLAELMVGVEAGAVELDRAGRVTKLAAQVNESFYSEIKVAQVRAAAGQAMPELGEMKLGDKVTELP